MLPITLLLSICSLAFAEAPGNTALKGKYHFVQLLMVGSTVGEPLETTNLGGTLTFDGKSGYTFTAMRGSGLASSERIDGFGAYTVSSNGFVEIANPARQGVTINARLGQNATAVLGSSTESADGICDFFLAVRAPDASSASITLNGPYTAASLLLPDGGLQGLATTLFQFNANSRSFTQIAAASHASDAKNVTTRKPVVNEAAYTLRADGTGEVPLGFFSSHQLFASFDGQVLLGFPTDAGQRGIFVAVRNAPQSSPWQGMFWMNEMLLDNEIAGAVRFTSSVGALNAEPSGRAVLSQRLNTLEPWRDLTAVNEYQTGQDGSGQLGPSLMSGRTNFALGPDVFLGAQIGQEEEPFRLHGLFFGVRAMDAPMLARNAASLSPPTAPISAGSLVTLSASGLDADDTHILFNDIDAPALGRASGTITVLAPPSLQGDSVVVTATQDANNIGSLIVPLAATSPGVFTTNGAGTGWAILQHQDGQQVNGENPATPGETVVVAVTGVNVNSSLQAIVDGNITPIISTEQSPESPGYLRLSLRVPTNTTSGFAIPLAIASANAFTCMADIPVR